jgi:DNA uptake protein ComE-like DNA-binding protein
MKTNRKTKFNAAWLFLFLLPLVSFYKPSIEIKTTSAPQLWDVDIETRSTKSWTQNSVSAEVNNQVSTFTAHLEVSYDNSRKGDQLFVCQFNGDGTNPMVSNFTASGNYLETYTNSSHPKNSAPDDYTTTTSNSEPFALKYVEILIQSKTDFTFGINGVAPGKIVTIGVHPDPMNRMKTEPYDETPDMTELNAGMGGGTNDAEPNTDCKFTQTPDETMLISYQHSEKIYKYGSDNPDKTTIGTETSSGTIRIRPHADQMEAIIIPPADYKNVLPEPGKKMTFKVVLKNKTNPSAPVNKKAQFHFLLANISNEKGESCNFPLNNGGTGADEKIMEENNPALTIDADEKTADSKDGLTASEIVISMEDWAAFATLQVTAILDDQSRIVAHVENKPDLISASIPMDENHNRIGDAWERKNGIFEKNLSANYDEDQKPDQQNGNGDGITLHEEYRGFNTLEDVSIDASKLMRQDKHVRLDPSVKDVFMCDETGTFKTFFAPYNAAKCNWHLVDKQMMIVDDASIAQVKIFDAQCVTDRPVLAKYASAKATDPVAVDVFEKKFLKGFMQISTKAKATKHRTININSADENKIKELKGLYMMNAAGLPYNIAGIAVFPDESIPNGSLNRCGFILVGSQAFAAQIWKATLVGTNYAADPTNTQVANVQYENTIIHEIGHGIGIHHHYDAHGKESDEGKVSGVTACAMRYIGKSDVDSGTILNHMNIYCTTKDNCYSQIDIKCLK